MKILVRNLDRSVSREELSAMFKPFGVAASCDLVMDKSTGLSKGFGFVEMPNESEARQAIENLNGKKVRKEKIRVKRTLRGVPYTPYQPKSRTS